MKKFIKVIAILLVAGYILSGCDSSDTKTENTTAGTTATQTTTTAQTTVAEKPTDEGPTSIFPTPDEYFSEFERLLDVYNMDPDVIVEKTVKNDKIKFYFSGYGSSATSNAYVELTFNKEGRIDYVYTQVYLRSGGVVDLVRNQSADLFHFVNASTIALLNHLPGDKLSESDFMRSVSSDVVSSVTESGGMRYSATGKIKGNTYSYTYTDLILMSLVRITE